MSNTTDDLQTKKQHAIADIITPASPVDIDADVANKFIQRNLWTRLKYTIAGTILFMAPVLFIQHASDDAPAKPKTENTTTPPKSPAQNPVIVFMALALAGVSGAGVGHMVGNARARRRMYVATVNVRSGQILPLLDILKTRPWTPDEQKQIDTLSSFTSRGKRIPQPLHVNHKLVAKMSELDPGYYDGERQGKLRNAPQWVPCMIYVGHYSR